MSTGFDLQGVKKQAEEELASLSSQEEEILKQLEQVLEKKSEIEEFLGIKKASTGARRNRYRTKVKSYFEDVDTSEASIEADAESLLDELFNSDKSMLNGLKMSMARLGREDDDYSYNSDTSTLTYLVPVE